MSDYDQRFEVRDHKGNFIHRYAKWVEARNYAADATYGLGGEKYFTLWWVDDWGCPNALVGHAARGVFHLRPCLGAR